MYYSQNSYQWRFNNNKIFYENSYDPSIIQRRSHEKLKYHLTTPKAENIEIYFQNDSRKLPCGWWVEPPAAVNCSNVNPFSKGRSWTGTNRLHYARNVLNNIGILNVLKPIPGDVTRKHDSSLIN